MFPLRSRNCWSSVLKKEPFAVGGEASFEPSGACPRAGGRGTSQSPFSSWRTINFGSKRVHSVMTKRLFKSGTRENRTRKAVASTMLRFAFVGSATLTPRRTSPLQGVYMMLRILISVPNDRSAASRIRCWTPSDCTYRLMHRRTIAVATRKPAAMEKNRLANLGTRRGYETFPDCEA